MRRLSVLFPLVVWLAFLGLTGCVSESLVTERYSASFYEIPRVLPDSIAADETRFLVVGDVQSGWRAEHKFYRRENWVTWRQLLFPFYQLSLVGQGVTGAINYKRGVPDYGAAGRDLVRRALWDEFGERQPAFWMILGDMAAHDGRRAEHWGQFLQEYRPLMDAVPLLPVLGNHEYSNDPKYGNPNFQAIFGYDGFYVQDTPHASLFVLDSNFLIDQHGLLEDHALDRLFETWFVSNDSSAAPSWLERELEKRKDRPFKIVAMHHPLLTYSFHSEDWHEDHHGPRLLEKRKALLDLFARYNVQLVFGGHEHIYEHNLARWSAPGVPERTIHQVITSGGGVPPRARATALQLRARQAQYDEEALQVTSVRQEYGYHYTVVDVSAKALVVETRKVDPRRVGRHTVLERIEIPAPAPAALAAPAPASVVAAPAGASR